MIRTTLICMFSLLAPLAAHAEDAARAAMEEYSLFAPYDAGIILPAQITPDIKDSLAFIDTRTAEEHQNQTIPGAIHIEWREVFTRLDEIPKDRRTVLFCNTGALSAQAAFGLRVLGYENVLILQTGFEGWQAHQASAQN